MGLGVGGKKSLKIPKGNQNPYIEEEQTTQRKSTKRTNNDLQNIHIKLKIEQHEPHYKLGVNPVTSEG